MRKRMEKTAPYLYILPMILVVGIVIIYTQVGSNGKRIILLIV